MCMSNVYLGNKTEANLVAEDVAYVTARDGSIEVNTIFGAGKSLNGYSIREVNLMENYIILQEDN